MPARIRHAGKNTSCCARIRHAELVSASTALCIYTAKGWVLNPLNPLNQVQGQDDRSRHAGKNTSCRQEYVMPARIRHAGKNTSCRQEYVMPARIRHAGENTSCRREYVMPGENDVMPGENMSCRREYVMPARIRHAGENTSCRREYVMPARIRHAGKNTSCRQEYVMLARIRHAEFVSASTALCIYTAKGWVLNPLNQVQGQDDRLRHVG